ncbi:hypothetical protein [Mycolicibacterium vaccae]|uniref:hypothetical protein n=1 Tax=Mycolicibacterium vaccae TaxID=1810 RepID=UPI003D053914
MSRKSQAKRARRDKRRAERNRYRLSAREQQELEVVENLEEFDTRLTERGWAFSEEADDDVGVVWFWPPSHAEVADDTELVDATVVLLTPDDGGETAHVVFVGTAEDHQFGLEELFEHIDTIEAYRLGQPLPVFD